MELSVRVGDLRNLAGVTRAIGDEDVRPAVRVLDAGTGTLAAARLAGFGSRPSIERCLQVWEGIFGGIATKLVSVGDKFDATANQAGSADVDSAAAYRRVVTTDPGDVGIR
ncbi:MAG: hypothetical protein GEV07_05590 [Streptosporangiales bacterium]|nr:hypothetical protein [Streptosporangiales bacterium]